mgnify:CR=1 FL=1
MTNQSYTAMSTDERASKDKLALGSFDLSTHYLSLHRSFNSTASLSIPQSFRIPSLDHFPLETNLGPCNWHKLIHPHDSKDSLTQSHHIHMSSEEADSTSPHPSPSSTSSLASSTLPTPSQPYASRQGSLSYAPTSPRLGRSASMSSPPPSNSMEQGKTLDRPPVIKTSSSSSSTTDLPEMIISFPSPTDSKSGSSHESKRSPKRSATSPQFRAPPPPPIIIRRPTDVSARPLNLSQHGSTARNVPSPTYANHWGGLNISGLPREPLSSTSEPSPLEETDSLPELLQTPHRAFFANASAEGAPISPAWQPLEASPRLHQALASGTDPSPRASSSTSSHSADPPIPFSPLGAPRRSSGLFEPTPQHGIHARNLSNFFPRPGQSSRDGLMPSPEPLQDAPHVLPAGKERKMFGGKGDWSFGHNANEVSSDSLSSESAETKRSKRRGHHASIPRVYRV